MRVGGQRHAPADLPPGKTRCSLYRRLGGPQGRSVHFEGEINLLPLQGLEPRGERSASRSGRSLTPGRTRYPLYRRLDGPQGRSGQAPNISPPPGFDPRTVLPVASHYTDWANPVPRMKWKKMLRKKYTLKMWYFCSVSHAEIEPRWWCHIASSVSPTLWHASVRNYFPVPIITTDAPAFACLAFETKLHHVELYTRVTEAQINTTSN